MKITFLTAIVAGFIFVSCQPPCEEKYFTESPEIDLGKKLLDAYLIQNWDAYPELHADTAKIWVNANWTNTPGFTVAEYVESLKQGLEPASDYRMEPQDWEMTINENGEHWVHFWTVWIGNVEATGKEYQVPVHSVMMVADNKIVYQGDIFNQAELALDMMALAAEADNDDVDDDEEEGDDDD